MNLHASTMINIFLDAISSLLNNSSRCMQVLNAENKTSECFDYKKRHMNTMILKILKIASLT